MLGKKISLLVFVFFLCGVTALVFQNCSRASFSQKPVNDPGVGAKCLPGETLVGGQCVTEENSCSMRTANSDVIEVRRLGQCSCPAGTQSQMDGSTLVCGSENICKNDEYKVNGQCVVFQCKSYQEIVADSNGTLNVPLRNASTGICYYTKVINNVPGPSDSTQIRVSENILSRNHDDAALSGNIKPKNLGFKKLDILLSDKRALKLVGKEKTESSKLYIDNYFLVRMNSDSYLQAYGTRDASVDTKDQYSNWYGNAQFSDYILYNDRKVILNHFIEGGKAHVTPIDITGSVRIGVKTDLNVHALDCGADQYLEDVYLLLQ
jgi:hypothetical protein